MQKYYKTTFQVVVLSLDEGVSGADLETIGRETCGGGWVGSIDAGVVERMDPQQAVAELHKAGSEPETFGLDDSGRRVMEDSDE